MGRAMSFGQPLWLVLLGVLPLLAWWLATGARPPAREWPSLELWPREPTAPISRRRRRLPLHAWPALAAWALAVLAVAAPRWIVERSLPLRVFVDRSASMGARDASGRTRFDLARDALRRALRAEDRSTPVELIAWPGPELVHRGTAASAAEALAAIAALPRAGAEQGPSAGELGTGRIWWCGDRAPEDLPPQSAFFSVGEPLLRNVGIVSARFDAHDALWLSCASTGAEPVEFAVVIEPGHAIVAELRLEPGMVRTLRIDPALGARVIALRMTSGGPDDLELDDALTCAFDAVLLRVRAEGLPEQVERAFRVDERLDFTAGPELDLLICGDTARASDPARATLRFGRGSGSEALLPLQWEDPAREELWRKLEPTAFATRALEGALHILARATAAGGSGGDGAPVIARSGREILCAFDAEELARRLSARAELPLLCALLVDEAAALLVAPRIATEAGAPLDLGESRAELAGVERAENEDGRREREAEPLGLALTLAAAAAWTLALLLRTSATRSS